jgi:hypothetical protein
VAANASRPNRAARRREPAHFDPFYDDPQLREVYHLLMGGRWADVDAALDSFQAEAWFIEGILVDEATAVETVVFERFQQARPSPRTLSLLGGAQVRDAWLLLDRIGVGAGTEQLDAIDARFQSDLVVAERTLHEAARLGPALADPWVHLLDSGRGLDATLGELRTRFDNAHSRWPFRPDACRQYLLGLSTRGGGADPAMFDFARWLELEAPLESPAHIALPMAHLEHGLGDDCNLSLTEYLTTDETVEELAPALDRFLRATPRLAAPTELPVLNAFGLAMTVTGAGTARLVHECFQRIDNRPTPYPWSLYVDERLVDVFTEIQRTQLRSAARYR